MGAKQSKRSVDISGKEAEGAGEVAAVGAVVEGRVEALADADALKPQLNGDAHIHEQTEKEKQLDSGTPENEKDATTEKEGKEQENESDKEKEAVPVTNGDTEPKGENGDSTPTPEDGKKPKKEKVKKKWSLRSISFSRKDKPKQEKKQKEEEPKTNGEPEKVPEEAAEATPEIPANDSLQESKSEIEVKDEKTPETPVTEPLTNGSSTPESPKVDTPPPEEPAPTPAPVSADTTASPEPERQTPKVEIQPEQLPVNGLSLEESKSEPPAVPQIEESKSEEQPSAETTETVPAPEIPVKNEVCVEQMPIESLPPPLPANPPPSSVASFAATTMAPELINASLANTAELAISAPHSILDNNTTEKVDVAAPAPPTDMINNNIKSETIIGTEINVPIETIASQFPPPLKESGDEKSVELKTEIEIEHLPGPVDEKTDLSTSVADMPEYNVDTCETIRRDGHADTRQATGDQPDTSKIETSGQHKEEIAKTSENEMPVLSECEVAKIPESAKNINNVEPVVDVLENVDDLPPPPPSIVDDVPIEEVVETKMDDVQDKVEVLINEPVVNSNHITENIHVNGETMEIPNGNGEMDQENLKKKSKDSFNDSEIVEVNGIQEDNVTKQAINEKLEPIETVLLESRPVEEIVPAAVSDDSAPPSLSEANESLPIADGGSHEASEAFPPPPSELCRSESDPTPAASPEMPRGPCDDTPQESLPVSDKLADLIPEVPVVPDLNTETETTSNVAVIN